MTSPPRSVPPRSVLESMRSFEDPGLGIRERFLIPELGGGRTIAVLSTPIGEVRTTGWVICHSFGAEQIYLQPHEVSVARRLAAAGFPVLRYHGQGYGDSELPPEQVTLGTHVRDALDAVAVLAAEAGTAEAGLIGARFGGTVAAIVADRIGASALVLWDPVVEGRPYVKSLLRLRVASELAGRAEPGPADPAEVLEGTGTLDVHGFPVGPEAFGEISSIDLPAQLDGFRGRSLVIQVSRSPEPRTSLQRLVARLRDLGGESRLDVVQDREALNFGLARHQPTGDGRKVDTQGRLTEALVSHTVSWCTGPTMDLPAIPHRGLS